MQRLEGDVASLIRENKPQREANAGTGVVTPEVESAGAVQEVQPVCEQLVEQQLAVQLLAEQLQAKERLAEGQTTADEAIAGRCSPEQECVL